MVEVPDLVASGEVKEWLPTLVGSFRIDRPEQFCEAAVEVPIRDGCVGFSGILDHVERYEECGGFVAQFGSSDLHGFECGSPHFGNSRTRAIPPPRPHSASAPAR